MRAGEAKWDFLRSADVLVLPTHSENFGIVVVESLTVGVPVLTTQGTPWADLEKYQCGWWIELSDSNLEVTLGKLINTPVLVLEEMGKQGRSLVNKKYEMKAVTDKMVDLYKIVLN